MSPRGFILVLTLVGAFAAWPESHAGRDAPLTGPAVSESQPAGKPARVARADPALPPIALRRPDPAARAPEPGSPPPAALGLLCALAFALYVGLRRVS